MAKRGGAGELPEAIEHLVDLLRGWGPVGARRMFSGFGLFRGDLMFGLVLGDTAYFKVDDGSRAEYEAAGSEPFRYQRSGRTVALSYYAVPPDVLDAADMLARWATEAHAAAARAAARKRRPGRARADRAGKSG